MPTRGSEPLAGVVGGNAETGAAGKDAESNLPRSFWSYLAKAERAGPLSSATGLASDVAGACQVYTSYTRKVYDDAKAPVVHHGRLGKQAGVAKTTTVVYK